MPWIVYLIPVLLVAMGIPLVARIVPPNLVFGFRVRKTLSDERVWYDANHVTGWDMVIAGVAQLVVVWTHPMLPVLRDLEPRQLVMATQMPILLLAILHSSWRVWRM